MSYQSEDRPRGWPCRQKCPEGSPCCCMTWSGSTHRLHICRNPGCACHSRERYDGPPKQLWTEVAVKHGIRFVQYNGVIGFNRLKPKDLTYDEWIDLRRARGEVQIPDEVAPGVFGDDLDLETFDNILDLMEEESNG